MALATFFLYFSESFWCSFSLTPSFRPVSPTYDSLQPLQGTSYTDKFTCLQIVCFFFFCLFVCFFCLWDEPTKISECWLVSSLLKLCISSKFSGTFLQCLQHRGSLPSLCSGCHFVCWNASSYVVYSICICCCTLSMAHL